MNTTNAMPFLPPRWTSLADHPTQVKAFQSKRRFNVIPAGRRCLAKGTLVATPNGPVPIENIQVGDTVIGYNKLNKPENTTVSHVYNNGIQYVYPISNSDYNVYFEATANHKLLVAEVHEERGTPNQNNQFRYHKVTVSDIQYRSSGYRVKIIPIKNTSNISDLDGIQSIQVKKGKPILKQTFDITVSNETNLYILYNPNCGIVTSNSGKTEIIGKRRMAMRCIFAHDKKAFGGQYYSKYSDPTYFIAAPTRDQVKRIYWSDMKALIPRWMMAKPPNESNLIITLLNGVRLFHLGLDKPERIEGSPWDWGLIDEIANVKPKAWPENIRPALSDRMGGCDFIGVPEGRNHYYDMYDYALRDMDNPDGEWAAYTWTSEEVLPLFGRGDEVESAKRYLDPLVYAQEYLASFVNFTGMVYYQFDRNIHVGRFKQFYNPMKPIIICFDFNVSPGVAVIGQEMGADVFDIPAGQTVTVWIDEVHIPRNSNTKIVCNAIARKWKDHKGLVICYGDSTGGNKGTAKLRGSDWDIIKAQLYPYFGTQLFFKVPKTNPRERQRINAVNSRFVSSNGDVRMLVDGNCEHLIKDFEGTMVLEGSAGEIDKKSDPTMSHHSDSVGYFVFKEYPVAKWYKRDDIDALYKQKMKEVEEQERELARI